MLKRQASSPEMETQNDRLEVLRKRQIPKDEQAPDRQGRDERRERIPKSVRIFRDECVNW